MLTCSSSETARGRAILGAAARANGRDALKYVAPEPRFRGVSRSLVGRIDEEAAKLGLSAFALTRIERAVMNSALRS